jgi:PAS domain S-box-containing protein
MHDDSEPASLSSNNISSIYEASDGSLWIGTGGYSLPGGGLNHFYPETGKAEHFVHDPDNPRSIASNDIMSLYGDDNGTLWIGTWQNGLDEMDFSNPRYFNHYTHDQFIAESIGSDAVWSLFRDRSGILWIGTANGGINKLSDTANRFSLYRHNPSNPKSLSMDMVGAFAQSPDDTIWVGTWGGGLNRLHPSVGWFERFQNDPQDENSLGGDLIMSLYVDSQGTLWIGTLGTGLDRYDPQYRKFTHYRHNPEAPTSLAEDNVSSILQDRTGALWIGTFGGLDRLEIKSGTFVHYVHNPNNPNSLAENKVVSLTLGSDNTLWIGTWGGGLASLDLNDPLNLDPKTAAVTSYRHDPDDPSSLVQDSVWSILEAPDGFIWLATEAGLDQFDPETKTFRHYTEKNGLSNTTILGILQDAQGNLWLTTNNGLNKFDPVTERFTVYTKSDGLQSNEFDSNAYLRARDGTLYVGGIHGFNAFNPAAIQPNPIPPEIVITGFQVYNTPVPTDLSGRDPIQLTYKQDFISFEFAALDFHAPQKNQYAYKLEGFDNDWIEARNRRYATYTNLPGGEYVFRVKASNGDGTWNEAGVGIPIVITPPVWQMWWFDGLLFVALSALVVGGFRWRLNAIREQNTRLETEVAERTSELRETNRLLEKEVEQRKRAEAELEKRAAEELQQSEQRFRVMFENAGIGIALIGLDRRPLEANAALIEMTGYSPEEFFQLSGVELSYPEDAEIGIPELKAVLEGKLNSYQIEKRYVRKNGQVYWVRLTNSVVRTPDGTPQYFVTMIEDINEQKRSAEELHKSQARFQAVFENAAVGIAIMSLKRQPIAFNPVSERIVGYSADELQNVDPSTLAIPEDQGIDTELFKELVEGKRNSYVMERRYRRKNGQVFWARINYSLVRDLEGGPDYLVGMIEDIDDQKRAAERLAAQEAEYRRNLEQRVNERTLALQHQIEQRQKAEKALAERAAHEAVTGERTRLARDLHDAVTQTLFSASLIAEVLPDIWDLNQAEGRKRLEELRQLTRGALAEMRTLLVELRPNALTEIPLPDLLRQLCESLIGRARLPIQLNVEGKRKLSPDVQISLYRITQEALNNVVKHAKATQVVVVLRLNGDVRLSVADNGCGFDPAAVPPDHLGLKIMHERADAIGADLSIYSEPGEGTQISVVWKEKG